MLAMNCFCNFSSSGVICFVFGERENFICSLSFQFLVLL